jgi:ubiquinone/menaquinone biosynthesis C-methylase UbiE
VHETADAATPPTTGGTVANHHHDHPGFAGPSGALMALLFAVKGGGRARFVCDLAGVGPADRVVDIGCGPGNAIRAAAALGATATGVDPSPVMLSVARALTVRRRSAITWAEGAAEAIPVADGSATVVWSVACVHHWADIDAGIAEIHRVLAPQGRVLAVERLTTADATGVASHGWTEQQAHVFAEACRRGGFADVDVATETIDGAPVLAVRAVRP